MTFICQISNFGKSLLNNPCAIHWHQIDETSDILVIGIKREALTQYGKAVLGLNTEMEFSVQQVLNPYEIKKQMKCWLAPYIFHDSTNNILENELEATIIDYFLKKLEGSHQNSRGTALQVSDVNINKVLEYMYSHYRENIEIEKLAQIAQMSKYHFIRTFKKWTRFTPYQYILYLRTREAESLLHSSNKTVIEIGMELGFSSTSQFYRVFMQYVGCSPRYYKNNV